MIDLSKFFFDESGLNVNPEHDYVCRVPLGLRERKTLFALLRRELRFPDYFGGNWDALSECLRDLSWIRQRRVIILHEDVPQLASSVLGTYLDVLCEAIQDWKPNEEHELVVVFPAYAQQLLTALPISSSS